MALVGGDEVIGRDPDRGGHAGAVLGDARGDIVRSHAAVEARIDSFRDAAVAREEGVPDSGERAEGSGMQRWRRVHDSNPGKGPSLRCAQPIALNSRPMPVRSARVRRWSAASMSGLLSGGT